MLLGWNRFGEISPDRPKKAPTKITWNRHHHSCTPRSEIMAQVQRSPRTMRGECITIYINIPYLPPPVSLYIRWPSKLSRLRKGSIRMTTDAALHGWLGAFPNITTWRGICGAWLTFQPSCHPSSPSAWAALSATVAADTWNQLMVCGMNEPGVP